LSEDEMSEVYVVIWEDRHSDTEIQVFANAAEAVLWACIGRCEGAAWPGFEVGEGPG
jgi:hypothetical protein